MSALFMATTACNAAQVNLEAVRVCWKARPPTAIEVEKNQPPHRGVYRLHGQIRFSLYPNNQNPNKKHAPEQKHHRRK